MNTFILMAEVISDPELRYTPDNKDAVASFLVQYPSSRPEEAPFRVKVTGWNNLANEIKEKYHKGDRLVIEGRLNMNMVERNGYKEKRAEITAQRIHPVAATESFVSAGAPLSSYSTPTSSFDQPTYKAASVPVATVEADPHDEYDDIPF